MSMLNATVNAFIAIFIGLIFAVGFGMIYTWYVQQHSFFLDLLVMTVVYPLIIGIIGFFLFAFISVVRR